MGRTAAPLIAVAAAVVALAQPSPPLSATPSSTVSPLGVSTLCTPGLGIIRFPDGELFGRFGSTVSTLLTVNDTMLITSSSGACQMPNSSQLGYKLTLPAEVVLGEGQLVVNTCTSGFNTLLAVGSGCPYSLDNFQCTFWNDNTPGCGSGGTGSQITINGPNLTSLVYYIVVGSQNRGQLAAAGGVFTLQWTYYATIPSTSPTRSVTATGSQTLSSTATSSPTLSSTATGSQTRSNTATGSQTRTGTPTPSQTPSTTGSASFTPSITGSSSVTPSNSKTGSGSRTGGSTRSSTATSTASSTATSSVSATRTPTGTASETATATGSTSGSRTGSITSSLTAGATPSDSPSCFINGQRTGTNPGVSGERNITLLAGRRADASGGVCDGRFLDPAYPSHMLLLYTRAGIEPWGVPLYGVLFVDICALNTTNASARAIGPNITAALGFGCPSSFVNYRCRQSWSGPRNFVPGPPREPCPAGSVGLSFAFLKCVARKPAPVLRSSCSSRRLCAAVAEVDSPPPSPHHPHPPPPPQHHVAVDQRVHPGQQHLAHRAAARRRQR